MARPFPTDEIYGELVTERNSSDAELELDNTSKEICVAEETGGATSALVTSVGTIIGVPLRRQSTHIQLRTVIVHKELTIDHDGFKKLMLDQTNTAKIRPILLSFNGLVESNEKTKALNHLLGHYVDESPLNPMTKKCGNKLESEGITYYELVAAGFSLRNISVAEVSKESSCAFGILSAFKQKLLSDHEAPRFVPVDDPQQGVPSRKIFEDPSLDEHFREVHKYLSKDKHLSKGNLSMILQVLPEGIALVNVWDININEKVQHVLQALKGHLFNMHIWLVLDVLKDKEQSKNPPEVQSGTSDLTKSRSPLDYQLRSGRMCESHKEERKGAITIFGNYSGHQSEQQLKQNIANLEMEIMQRAKHIGIASLVEPAIHPINLNTNDSSFHLYWKFLQLVYDKPYVDVPVSWIFLRSLFYRSTKQFIAKSDLLAKAKECGMSEASLNEFCVFYTSFGSIFDLTLVDPNYKYVIVKPIGFLKSLNTILSPADEMCRKYPSLQYGIISGNVLKELFHENWQVFIDALVSLRLATQVDNESLEISPANSKASYYFVPLSRSSADRRNASVVATQIVDSTAVNLVTTIDTPHVCKQAFIAKYLLESLPNSKLVNCNDKITVAVRDVSTGATVTMVSSNPITQFIITQPSPRICRLIVEAMKKIANLYKEGTVKYKYIVFCAKTRRHQLDVLSVLSTSQYHILPNDDLCKECQKVGKVDKQLLAWNDALRICPVPSESSPDKGIKPSELVLVAEKLSSCDQDMFAEVFGFLNYRRIPQFRGFEREKLFIQLLFAWDSNASRYEVEPRRTLARKIIELGSKHYNAGECPSEFEYLAKEIDDNVPSVNRSEEVSPMQS